MGCWSRGVILTLGVTGPRFRSQPSPEVWASQVALVVRNLPASAGGTRDVVSIPEIKPDTEDYRLSENTLFSFIWYFRKDVTIMTESRSGEENWLQRVMRELFGVLKLFCILIEEMVTWLYLFVRMHQIVHLKLVNFLKCKLYSELIFKSMWNRF